MPHSLLTWSSITWFGDTALLLPAAAAFGVVLLLQRSSHGLAVRWAIAYGSAGLLVLATKIAFMGWGLGIASIDFTGLSGHSALAAAFWPAAGWMATQCNRKTARYIGIFIGVALSGAIGISRHELGAHSASEIVSGLLVGMAASGWFVSHALHTELRHRGAAMVALVFIGALVMTQHGRPAPTTALIERTVMRLLGVAKPFTRHQLHTQRV